jgi:hypothetical protein
VVEGLLIDMGKNEQSLQAYYWTEDFLLLIGFLQEKKRKL